MAVIVGERARRNLEQVGGTLTYIAMGAVADDEAAIKAAVLAVAPASYNNGARQNPIAKEIGFTVDAGVAKPTTWEVEIRYGPLRGLLKLPPVNTVIWSGDTGGGTQHITTSKEARVYEVGGEVSLLSGQTTIGADRDSVRGVGIVVPSWNFQAVKYIATADWTAAYRRKLFTLTGKVNDDTWTGDSMDFAAGEVLFLGATWSARSSVDPNDVEVTFRFSANPNLAPLPDPVGGIVVARKDGWEYLDVLYEDALDDVAQLMDKEPKLVKVHRVYDAGNFGDLNL